MRRVDAVEWGGRLAAVIERHRVPGATLGSLCDGEITATGAGVTMQAAIAPAGEVLEVDIQRYLGRYERSA